MAKKAQAKRASWFDEKSHHLLLEQHARQLDSFLQAMADGKVDANELHAQEERLVALMKEIEPQLDDALHEKVTRLLCELVAYDQMQMVHTMQEARPKGVFRG
jgi:sirohydrochlorin ferrochelatase